MISVIIYAGNSLAKILTAIFFIF